MEFGKKILFILPEFYPSSGGGIITFYTQLIKSFIDKGLKPTILVGSGASCNLFEGEWEGCKIYSLQKYRLDKFKSQFLKFSTFPNIQSNLAAAWAMYEQANEIDEFDIIECTDWGWGYIPWVMNQKHKTIVQFHASIGEIFYNDPINGKELEANISQNIELQTLPYANMLISHSKATQLSWEKLLNKSVVYQLPVYYEKEIKNDGTVENIKKPYVLVVGRVQYWKGPTVLCQAYQILKEKAPDTLWIGRTANYQNTDMGSFLTVNYPNIWNKKIVNIPQIEANLVENYQLNASFIIIPSVWDVFNFTCVEAMALGKIVICSTGAGASDIIEDGVNGFIFEKENPQSLAKVIEKVICLLPEEIRSIGLTAQKTVQLKLNPNSISEQRIELYKSLIINNIQLNCNSWISDFVCPSNAPNNISGILENIPIKTISAHLKERLIKKIIK